MKIQGNQGLTVKSIKKIGHCCLVIDMVNENVLAHGESKNIRIMTDPGSYTTGQEEEKNLDYIIISHEHGDHVHVESLKKVLENNKNCKIITNNSVKIILEKEDIECEVLEQGERSWESPPFEEGVNFSEGKIRGGGSLHLFAKTVPHVDIYDTVPVVDNTAYFINNQLLYPGDAWVEIPKPVEILALPVSGPWCKIRDVLEYALKIKPKICFPVHDGMLKENGKGMVYGLPTKVLGEKGIEFKKLNDGESLEF